MRQKGGGHYYLNINETKRRRTLLYSMEKDMVKSLKAPFLQGFLAYLTAR